MRLCRLESVLFAFMYLSFLRQEVLCKYVVCKYVIKLFFRWPGKLIANVDSTETWYKCVSSKCLCIFSSKANMVQMCINVTVLKFYAIFRPACFKSLCIFNANIVPMY